MKKNRKLKSQKKRIKENTYPIDSGGIIHMASLEEGYANTYRMRVTLKEKVDKDILREAYNDVKDRFPTIVAGVRKGLFSYYIKPVKGTVDVFRDEGILCPFTESEIKECAMKVLYKDNMVSIEVFHSLTDASGGAVFFRTLLARYIELKYGDMSDISNQILSYKENVCDTELMDDYVKYAKGRKSKANKDIVYRIPGEYTKEDGYLVHTSRFNTKEILDKAHEYNTSLTTYLTVKMVESIYKIQDSNKEDWGKTKDIQIMVPINLRNRFKSETLRNFTLYALPKYTIEDKDLSTSELVDKTSKELKSQFDIEKLQKMMAINAYTQNTWIIKYMPLIIKEKILKIVYKMYGERNSCISVSNFGEISFGESVNKYVQDVEFILTPRRNAAYNCSLISYNRHTNISISMRGKGCGLENIYMK